MCSRTLQIDTKTYVNFFCFFLSSVPLSGRTRTFFNFLLLKRHVPFCSTFHIQLGASSVPGWEVSEDRTTPRLEIMLYKSLFQFCQWVLLKYFKLHFSDVKWDSDEAKWVRSAIRLKMKYIRMYRPMMTAEASIFHQDNISSNVLIKRFRLMNLPTRQNFKYCV